MSNLIEHAERVLTAIGYDPDQTEEGPNKLIGENVFELLKVFAAQGHSGASATYCIDYFTKLASFEPLTPRSEYSRRDVGSCKAKRLEG